jgi:hypothetical protein
MTKDEMTTLLRSVGVNENTITAMNNAFDLGADLMKEDCARFLERMAQRHEDIRKTCLEVAAEQIRAGGLS